MMPGMRLDRSKRDDRPVHCRGRRATRGMKDYRHDGLTGIRVAAGLDVSTCCAPGEGNDATPKPECVAGIRDRTGFLFHTEASARAAIGNVAEGGCRNLTAASSTAAWPGPGAA